MIYIYERGRDSRRRSRDQTPTFVYRYLAKRFTRLLRYGEAKAGVSEDQPEGEGQARAGLPGSARRDTPTRGQRQRGEGDGERYTQGETHGYREQEKQEGIRRRRTMAVGWYERQEIGIFIGITKTRSVATSTARVYLSVGKQILYKGRGWGKIKDDVSPT